MTDTLHDVGPDGFHTSQMEATLLANSINMTPRARVCIKVISQVSNSINMTPRARVCIKVISQVSNSINMTPRARVCIKVISQVSNSINMTPRAYVCIKVISQVSDRNNRLDGSTSNHNVLWHSKFPQMMRAECQSFHRLT